ncbi:MAG: protein-methionine-sulfoxide reductase catalytic subunit MsrP, partial [Anaerolineales bacterium]|nr:protein-methionine-sulfoxide reductase catalytic subunit MsrP [Anaerolineales bacterium]
MSISLWKSVPIRSAEITPKSLYLRRREFLKLGAVGTAAALLAACSSANSPLPTATTPVCQTPQPGQDEYGDPLTLYEAVTNYNNYYEFSTDKEAVARLAKDFQTRPWTVEVGGLVAKPRVFDIDDLLTKYPQEERIYRLRCVEGWSMVIPWLGFPLSKLLKEVEPLGSARYVSFVSVSRPEEMPGMRSSFYPWPYREGLRLDEALHDLTILATGLYGEVLPNQNGAPLRLVVPWKYGFKSAKAIIKIELTELQPATFWNLIAPDEYGFYSNVNPQKPHPRWSQATERRIGES